MRWTKIFSDLFRIRQKVRNVIPPRSVIDHYDAPPKPSFTETDALVQVPTLAKIHSLITNAANRFNFQVRSFDKILPLQSYKFDYSASPALADWFVVGYCMFDENLNYIPVADFPERDIDADKVLVIRNIASPFKSIQPILSASFEFYRILNQVLRNAGAHVFASVKAGVSSTPSEVENVRNIMKTKRRAAGVGGVELLSVPLDFHSISSDLASLKLSEIATLLNREICDAYSIDSSLLNDPENKTYSNKSEALKALYTHTLIPVADRFCEAMTNAFTLRGYYYTFTNDISAIETILEDRMLIWSLLKDAYEIGIIPSERLRAFVEKTTNKETQEQKA